jgi:hypothetical protein
LTDCIHSLRNGDNFCSNANDKSSTQRVDLCQHVALQASHQGPDRGHANKKNAKAAKAAKNAKVSFMLLLSDAKAVPIMTAATCTLVGSDPISLQEQLEALQKRNWAERASTDIGRVSCEWSLRCWDNLPVMLVYCEVRALVSW